MGSLRLPHQGEPRTVVRFITYDAATGLWATGALRAEAWLEHTVSGLGLFRGDLRRVLLQLFQLATL